MKNHNYRNISPEITDFFPVFENSLVSCADQAVTWPGCEKYAEKLYKLKETIVQKAFSIYTRNEDDFNVLTHGDFWANNIMYKGNNLESIMVSSSRDSKFRKNNQSAFAITGRLCCRILWLTGYRFSISALHILCN